MENFSNLSTNELLNEIEERLIVAIQFAENDIAHAKEMGYESDTIEHTNRKNNLYDALGLIESSYK